MVLRIGLAVGNLGGAYGESAMAWWVWLLLSWTVIAVLVAVLLSGALRISEERDWLRRGRPDRRSRPREGDLEEWIRQGRPERRSASPEQERDFLAARAAAGHTVPNRRRRRRSVR